MKEKQLVVTSYRWNLRTKYHNEIKRIKALAGIECTIDIKYMYLGKPEIVERNNGKRVISHEWFENNLGELARAGGYTHVKFVFSMQDGRNWGIDSNIRASNIKDRDNFGEAWIRCDEKSITKTKDGKKWSRYVKSFLHEDGHEYKNQKYTNLDIHDYDHYDKGDIIQFYEAMVLEDKISMLQQIIKILTFLVTFKNKNSDKLIHPVDEYKEMISNQYGTINWNRYPATGRHIGTDFETPIGTAVKAPWKGEVIASGYSEILGNYCHYTYTYSGQKYTERYLHLKYVPKLGKHHKGAVIAKTGQSGNVTGPHLHIDIWLNDVKLDIITKGNWNKLTINPEEHYV